VKSDPACRERPQPVGEQAAVGQAGEVVVKRLSLYRFLGALAQVGHLEAAGERKRTEGFRTQRGAHLGRNGESTLRVDRIFCLSLEVCHGSTARVLFSVRVSRGCVRIGVSGWVNEAVCFLIWEVSPLFPTLTPNVRDTARKSSINAYKNTRISRLKAFAGGSCSESSRTPGRR